MHHVFFHVVRSTHDHFAGLRAAIDSWTGHSHETLTFEEAQFDLVKEVEYTGKRLFRILYYRPLYCWLIAQIDRVIACAGDEDVTLYFADESIWAVILADHRQRLGGRRLHTVNVQHGFAIPQKARFKLLRRALNGMSRLVFGFPAIGYGTLGDAGKKAFDLYLTYDDLAAAFVREKLGIDAVAAPHLIKHDLLDAYRRVPAEPHALRRALFAMNMKIAGSPILCDVPQTLDALMPLAEALHEREMVLIVRLHPGMEIERERMQFASHPIARLAELDTAGSLQESIARAGIVMSFLSTVLWEAGLVGRMPVQVMCSCCREVELGYARETLRLDPTLKKRLAAILEKSHSKVTPNFDLLEAQQWHEVRLRIARLGSCAGQEQTSRTVL